MDTAEVSVDSGPLIDELRNDTTPTIYEGGATSWNRGLRGKVKTTLQTCSRSLPGMLGLPRSRRWTRHLGGNVGEGSHRIFRMLASWTPFRQSEPAPTGSETRCGE